MRYSMMIPSKYPCDVQRRTSKKICFRSEVLVWRTYISCKNTRCNPNLTHSYFSKKKNSKDFLCFDTSFILTGNWNVHAPKPKVLALPIISRPTVEMVSKVQCSSQADAKTLGFGALGTPNGSQIASLGRILLAIRERDQIASDS
jgi:hypothetical protein